MPPLTLLRSPDLVAHEIDGATLAAAARGEAGACRALLAMYQKRVFAVVGRTLGSRPGTPVEDVCQECFLRVFQALERFDSDGPAKLSTWIFTIALRLCFDELRRARRRSARIRNFGRNDAEGYAPDLAEPMAIEKALKRRVERAVDELPDDLKATFVLRVVGELSVADTARALGVDEGTIKSRLSRARARLRAAVGDS